MLPGDSQVSFAPSSQGPASFAPEAVAQYGAQLAQAAAHSYAPVGATPQAAAAGHVLGEVGEYMGEAAAPKPGEDAPKPGDMYAFSADPPESYAGESEAR